MLNKTSKIINIESKTNTCIHRLEELNANDEFSSPVSTVQSKSLRIQI